MIQRKVINSHGIGYEGEKIHHSKERFLNGYEIRLSVEESSEMNNKSLPLIIALNSYINKETYKRQKIIDDKVKEYKKKGGTRRIIYNKDDNNYYSESDEYNDNEELNTIYDEVQILNRTILDFKPKNKAELVKLIEKIINEINGKNEEFIWTNSIDFEIYDRKLQGNSHKMISVKPSDIQELNNFEINLNISNIVMDVFKDYLNSQNINMKNLHREQWVYLIANWFMEKPCFKTSTGLWYLPYHENEYNYDYLINFYEISIEDIIKEQEEINELKNDMLNIKSIEIINNVKIFLADKGVSEIDFKCLDYDDWIEKINEYLEEKNIEIDETFIFRPLKSIEENLEYTVNHYRITYEDLQKTGYISGNDIMWSFFDKEGPEKAIDDLLDLENF